MNLVKDLISPGLFESWDLFNHETQVNFIYRELLEKLKDDPTYEVFVKLKYVKCKTNKRVILEYREYPDVLISNKGRVYKITDGEFYEGSVTRKGYCVFNANYYIMMRHRALAYNFIPKPERHKDKSYAILEVNHIDGDPGNYDFFNLEWMTGEENKEHARETGLVTRPTGINHPNVIPMLATVVDIPGYRNFQFVVVGQKECSFIGVSHKVLFKARQEENKHTTHKGCKWEAVNLDEADLYPREVPEDLIKLIKGYKYQRAGKINASKQKHIYIATNIETGEVRELIGSIQLREAEFPYQNVLACIAGRRKQCAGHTFKVKPLAR